MADLLDQLRLHFVRLVWYANAVLYIDFRADIDRMFFLVLLDMDSLHPFEISSQKAVEQVALDQSDPSDLRQTLQRDRLEYPRFDIADENGLR